jgi:hypothetical protein
MTEELGFRQELPEFVSVAVDGGLSGIDPDVTSRVPGRVVVVMPDFTADAISHALTVLGELADRLGLERDWIGERELAAALSAAARSAGFHCPEEPSAEVA